MSLGNRIKKIRRINNMTLEEFGIKVGLSPSAVRGIEENLRGQKKGIGTETIIRICKAFKVNSSWLLFGDESNKDLPMIATDIKNEYKSEPKYNALPIINNVPAGYPDYPLDDEIRSYFYIPGVPKNAFGLIVDGVSMEPELFTGDIVIVNPNQLELRKGEIGVFRYHGGTTIKICMPLPDNKGFLLQARNPRSESYIVTDETCTIIGKVIFKIVKCK